MHLGDKWIRDTGLVFAALFLILGWKDNPNFLAVSALFIVLVLFAPVVLTPLAWVWLKVAEILGFVMNKVFFGLVFFLVVVPVGVLKRLLTGDQRDLKKQPNRTTAFIEREIVVEAKDLANPF